MNDGLDLETRLLLQRRLPTTSPAERGTNFTLAGERQRARGWPARARDKVAAIVLSNAIEGEGSAPTAAEQEKLRRFIGFGAIELASMKAEMERHEDRRIEIAHALPTVEVPPPLLHPSLADIYRREITSLAASLSREDNRTEAAEIIRPLARRSSCPPKAASSRSPCTAT